MFGDKFGNKFGDKFGFFKKKDKKPFMTLAGSAELINGEWKVKFAPGVQEQIDELPPAAKAEVMEFIKGVTNGKIDPLTMGKRMCAYCGEPVDRNREDSKEGTNMCTKCEKNLV